MLESPIRDIIERLPDEAQLRGRLAENLRERDLIRKLLRVAEEKQKLTNKQGAAHAS